MRHFSIRVQRVPSCSWVVSWLGALSIALLADMAHAQSDQPAPLEEPSEPVVIADGPDAAASEPSREETVEARLNRLEAMFKQLVERTAAPPADKQSANNARPHVESSDAQARRYEPMQELAAEAERSLSQLVRTAQRQAELAQTALQRMDAASRQLEAVHQAYQADTVTLEQWLEAQRRLLGAQRSYARAASGLCPDPVEREFLLRRADLAATNAMLDMARKSWQAAQASTGGQVEQRDAAQAREQFFQLKSQTSAALEAYLEAEEALKTAQAGAEARASQAQKQQAVREYLRHLRGRPGAMIIQPEPEGQQTSWEESVWDSIVPRRQRIGQPR